MPVDTETTAGPSSALATSMAGTKKLGTRSESPVNDKNTDQRFQ